ncbi:hypothetical protein J7643_03015 [bacterium]|nr:hypothetical protein [bacterium]
MRRLLLLGLITLFAATPQPAEAALGGSRASFERFLKRVPKSQWKIIPDSADGGVLYTGRVGSLGTIVRVYYDQGRVTHQKVEVALPNDTSDEFALAILTRFMSEFAGHPEELKQVMTTLRTMRKTVMASGRRSAQMPYRNAQLTLSLDSSTTEFSDEVPWGTLYWKAEATARRSGGGT